MPSASLRRADQLPDDRQRNRIEPGERLVVHDQHRIERDRARQRDAARHAAGQLGRHQLRGAAQAHRIELHQHQVANHRFRQVGVLAHRERDVLEHRHVGEQGAELEQHAELAAQRVERIGLEVGDRLPADQHLALLRLQLASDQAQDRRLPGPARAHDRDDFSPRHGHRDPAQDRSRVVGERHVGAARSPPRRGRAGASGLSWHANPR